MDITHLTPDAEGSIEWPSFSNDKKAVVTLGAFDGMHLGHQAVIKRVVELAHQHDAFSVVILFDPRPAFVHGWVISHHGEEPAVQNVDAEALTSVDDRLHRMNSSAWTTCWWCTTRWPSQLCHTFSSLADSPASWVCARWSLGRMPPWARVEKVM